MNCFRRILFVLFSFFLVEAQAIRVIENIDFGLRSDGKLGEYPNKEKAYTYTTKTGDQVRGQKKDSQHYTLDVKKTQNHLTTVFESQYRSNLTENSGEDDPSVEFSPIHVTTLDGAKVTSYTMCTRSIEQMKLKFKNLQNTLSCVTITANLCTKFTTQMKKSNNPNDQKDRAFLFLNEFFRLDPDYQMASKSGMSAALGYSDDLLKNPDPLDSSKSAKSSKGSLWEQFKSNFVEKISETHNDPMGLLKERKKFDSENIPDLIFRKCRELAL